MIESTYCKLTNTVRCAASVCKVAQTLTMARITTLLSPSVESYSYRAVDCIKH